MTVQPAEILLVEDNAAAEELTLYNALRAHHLANSVEVVRDGTEALDFVSHTGAYAGRTDGPPRLILLDLKRPTVDGLEVLRQLKADPGTRPIPLVMLASSREERDVIDSYNLGVNSYICRPVDFGQFAEVVRQVGLYWLLVNQPPLS